MKLKIGVFDIIMLILSVLLAAGAATLFSPCGHMTESGGYMACHWAGVMSVVSGVILSVISLITLFMPDRKIKTGMSISAVPVSVAAMLTPGVFISLCKMPEMRCNAVMKPSVMLVSALIAVCALLNAVLNYTKSRKEN